jgi:hypothetical protein
MKTEIEFSVRKMPDNTFVLHYLVPNYSGSAKKQVRGDVYVSNITRAIERIEMITEYLKNPIHGKELREVMSATTIKQQSRK